jgi:hypothetical protein
MAFIFVGILDQCKEDQVVGHQWDNNSPWVEWVCLWGNNNQWEVWACLVWVCQEWVCLEWVCLEWACQEWGEIHVQVELEAKHQSQDPAIRVNNHLV